MRLKPQYIYLIGFVIVVILLVVFTSDSRVTQTPTPNESNIPKDDIHQNLGNAPGGGNVSSEFKQRMERLKNGYETNPNDIENAQEYARLLAAAHKPEEAVKIYNSILTKQNDRSYLRLELATVYFNLSQYEEAKTELKKVLEQRPNDAEVIFNLGAVEASMGNNNQAREIWEGVVKNYPNTEAAEFASSALQNLN